jgi:hypothetical protein
MNRTQVRYTIDGSPFSHQFDTQEEAEAFVFALLTSYGDANIQGLIMENLE